LIIAVLEGARTCTSTSSRPTNLTRALRELRSQTRRAASLARRRPNQCGGPAEKLGYLAVSRPEPPRRRWRGILDGDTGNPFPPGAVVTLDRAGRLVQTRGATIDSRDTGPHRWTVRATSRCDRTARTPCGRPRRSFALAPHRILFSSNRVGRRRADAHRDVPPTPACVARVGHQVCSAPAEGLALVAESPRGCPPGPSEHLHVGGYVDAASPSHHLSSWHGVRWPCQHGPTRFRSSGALRVEAGHQHQVPRRADPSATTRSRMRFINNSTSARRPLAGTARQTADGRWAN